MYKMKVNGGEYVKSDFSTIFDSKEALRDELAKWSNGAEIVVDDEVLSVDELLEKLISEKRTVCVECESMVEMGDDEVDVRVVKGKK